MNLWRLRFLDSAGFLQAPLASLVKNLASGGSENVNVTSRCYELVKFDLLLRKGIFPYEWLDEVRKLDPTELLPIEAFYSTLNEEGISVEDYKHATKVWSAFNMKTTRDYHDLYCRSDVLQLTDVFEYHRRSLMKTHGPDLLHFFTLTGFSWGAALKYTKQKLELISDREVYDFIQAGMRGGISSIITRHAKANNPYMGDRFDPSKETSYIQYLDANNLYGWVMRKRLSVGGFKWMTEEELGLPLNEIPPCFIKVDREYPWEMHDEFAEFVPAPNKSIPDGTNVEKLAPNLLPKINYMCHIECKLVLELSLRKFMRA